MATLYIANCQRQAHVFQYRVPAEEGYAMRRVLSVRIEPGTQQRIYQEAPLPVLEAIIAQHAPYGLVPVEEAVKTKGFVHLCYSFDKPVDFERFNYAAEHNKGVLFDRGQQMRTDAALAADTALEEHRQREQLPSLRSVEVEVIENSDTPQIAIGLDIDRPGRTPSRETLDRRARRE